MTEIYSYIVSNEINTDRCWHRMRRENQKQKKKELHGMDGRAKNENRTAKMQQNQYEAVIAN